MSISTNKRVYLACQPIFSGGNAHVRKLKKMKELIQANTNSLEPLLGGLGEKKLIKAVKYLLDNGIFASEERAELEFPGLFFASASRNAQHQESEIGAALTVAGALDEISSKENEDVGAEEEADPLAARQLPEQVLSEDSVHPQGAQHINGTTASGGITPPSLFPAFLPYQTQHLILNTVQKVLEESCFAYATRTMPSLLQRKKWYCPEAGELTKWVRVIRQDETLNFPSHSRVEILTSVANIRHTAVHRLPTPAKGIGRLLESAIKLTRVLQDEGRAVRLEELQLDIDGKTKAMELNKNVLEIDMSNKLMEIQKKREELDRMEQDLLAEVSKQDAENTALIGKLLEDSIGAIFTEEVADNSKEGLEGKKKARGPETTEIIGDKDGEEGEDDEDEGQELESLVVTGEDDENKDDIDCFFDAEME